MIAPWCDGDLASYLLDITVDVLRYQDDGTGRNLVDLVVDEAEQKGTGRWTASSALDLGVVASSTGAAVDARVLSAGRDLRARGAELIGAAAVPVRALDQRTIDDLRDALLAARVVAFSQGFDQLAAASTKYGWNLDLGVIAGLWRGGCIIRARILEHIVAARSEMAHDCPLVFEPWFGDRLRATDAGWRRTVSAAVADRIPMPVVTAALSYYDGLRRERSPANLIQALRDEFGAHGYRRLDRDGEHHSDWCGTGTEPQ